MTRISRRQWLSGSSALGLAMLERPAAVRGDTPILLGAGTHQYEWVAQWGPLPGGDYGNTHGGIVIDETERLYLNTDTTQAVLMFDLDGRYLGAWGQQFAGGLHGMALVRECGGEQTLYLTHTARHEVIKTRLDGTVLSTLPLPDTSGIYAEPGEYKPTGVAVAPSGHIYVADGYGLSWVHHYDATGGYVRSWGGRGNADGQFDTPHGIWIDTRGASARVLIADRENGRLQWFDLEGNFIKSLGGFRRPCGIHQAGGDLVIPELGGRVTILDKDDQVVTYLGDNPNEAQRAQNQVERKDWQDGIFIAPHSARWDSDGNLYVMDWNFRGRVSKLRRLP